MNEVEKILGLLENNPKACTVITNYFLKMMIESFVDQSVPEEYKEAMRAEGLSKERLSLIIAGAPRCLFDVFDESEIFIEVYRTQGESFTFNIDGLVEHPNHYQVRKQCELDAITEAFRLLETKEVPMS